MDIAVLMDHISSRDLRILTRLRPFFLVVDIGFILYWVVTVFHLIPAEHLYKDYADPMASAWNWSFLPLDLAVSATGLLALHLSRRRNPLAVRLAVASLALTTASGMQAISFWAIRGDFDWVWWAPNLFLLVYPWWFLQALFQVRPEGP
ncbi:MAG: hypothetical protein RL173_1419 [Fibrobacterota bacterium]|jgi:hypothetical protein